MHKIIIHFAVAAHEYSNAVGERFWRDYSFFYGVVMVKCICRGFGKLVRPWSDAHKQTQFIHKLFDTCLVSTMAPSSFGPHHGIWLEDPQTKCIGVVPAPWAMTHALGLVSFPLQHE